MKHKHMYMSNYVEQLDNILAATGEKLLNHAVIHAIQQVDF